MKIIRYPKFLFAWPLIFAPLLCSGLLQFGISSELVGRIYFFTLLLVLVTLGFDMTRNALFFTGLVLFALFLSHRVLYLEYAFPSLDEVFLWFAGLNLSYQPDFPMAVSIISIPLFFGMLIWSRVNDCWEVSPAEFRHTSLGVVDKALARGAKSVKASYPDMLEYLLGLSGTLHVYDAKGEEELARIEHVPFLPVKYRKLQKLLTPAPSTQSQDAVIEDEYSGKKKSRKTKKAVGA